MFYICMFSRDSLGILTALDKVTERARILRAVFNDIMPGGITSRRAHKRHVEGKVVVNWHNIRVVTNRYRSTMHGCKQAKCYCTGLDGKTDADAAAPNRYLPCVRRGHEHAERDKLGGCKQKPRTELVRRRLLVEQVELISQNRAGHAKRAAWLDENRRFEDCRTDSPSAPI
jgi:hypothetical protein